MITVTLSLLFWRSSKFPQVTADAASYSAAWPMNPVQQRYWSNQHSVFTEQYYNIAAPVTLIALGAGRGRIAPALHIQEKSNTAANKHYY